MLPLQKTLVLLALAQSQVFVSAAPLEERAADVCQSGIFAELGPILQTYSYAQALCSAAYPPQCTTANKRKRQPATTTAASSTASSRAPSITPAATSTASSTTKTQASSSRTSSVNSQSSALSRLLAQARATISAACSCIQTHKVSSILFLNQALVTRS